MEYKDNILELIGGTPLVNGAGQAVIAGNLIALALLVVFSAVGAPRAFPPVSRGGKRRAM